MKETFALVQNPLQQKLKININMIDYEKEYLVYNECIGNDDNWYIALPVLGDGHCFFHSVSYFVFNGDKNRHLEIRRNCVQFIQHNRNEFSEYFITNNDFESYLRNLSKFDGSVWADNLQIYITSILYNLQILIYEVNTSINRLINKVIIGTGNNVIRLMYYRQVHYWPLINMIDRMEIVENVWVEEIPETSSLNNTEYGNIDDAQINFNLEPVVIHKENVLKYQNTRKGKKKSKKQKVETPKEQKTRLAKQQTFYRNEKSLSNPQQTLQNAEDVQKEKERTRKENKQKLETAEERETRLAKRRALYRNKKLLSNPQQTLQKTNERKLEERESAISKKTGFLS